MQFPVVWPNVIPFDNVYLSLSPFAYQKQAGTRDERFTDASEFHHAGLRSAYLLSPFSAVLFLSSVINLGLLPGFSISNTKLQPSFMTMSVQRELHHVSP